jgi:hypothetical protein
VPEGYTAASVSMAATDLYKGMQSAEYKVWLGYRIQESIPRIELEGLLNPLLYSEIPVPQFQIWKLGTETYVKVSYMITT